MNTVFAFNTRDTKPKLWNIAILSVIASALIGYCLFQQPVNVLWIGWIATIYVFFCILFLLRAWIEQIHYNPYSYNTIYYIGFGLFLLSILITMIAVLIQINKHEYSQSTYLLMIVHTFISSAINYMLYSFPLIVVFSIGLFISNLVLIKHEGKSFVNILGILLSFLMIGGWALIFWNNNYVSGSSTFVMMHDIVINTFAALYLYYECMILGTIIANIIVTNYKPSYDQDYIIILGCGIRDDGTPTPLLQGRIDVAIDFYHKQMEETGKVPILITSGGQGSDEIISESRCMKNYLLSKGIPEEHIIEEDKSTNTAENMRNSKAIIDQRGNSDHVIYATTNYHVFRSGIKARKEGLKATGISAKTKLYFWPNALVREFVGLLTEHRIKQSIIIVSMIILYVSGTIWLFMG